jgi:hypothetical protein
VVAYAMAGTFRWKSSLEQMTSAAAVMFVMPSSSIHPEVRDRQRAPGVGCFEPTIAGMRLADVHSPIE